MQRLVLFVLCCAAQTVASTKGYGTKVDDQKKYKETDVSDFRGVKIDNMKAAITASFCVR